MNTAIYRPQQLGFQSRLLRRRRFWRALRDGRPPSAGEPAQTPQLIYVPAATRFPLPVEWLAASGTCGAVVDGRRGRALQGDVNCTVEGRGGRYAERCRC